jgi:hypothetical protein
MMLALAVLFAAALAWLTRKYPNRRRAILLATTVLLITELVPAPVTLYSAAVPRLYRHVAAANDDARVLELPFGVRDGTSSVGNFTARSQFYQTSHEKLLIGGYLSRVSSTRVAEIRSNEMLDGLIVLSEGGTLAAGREAHLVAQGGAFVRDAHVAFVVIDRDRTPPSLRSFAMRAFRLEYVESDGQLELYRPRRRW